MGQNEAIMECLIHIMNDLGEVKTEVKSIHLRMDAMEARLDAKIDAVEARLEEKIENVRIELEEKIENVKTELEEKIENVKTELQEEIGIVEKALDTEINHVYHIALDNQKNIQKLISAEGLNGIRGRWQLRKNAVERLEQIKKL